MKLKDKIKELEDFYNELNKLEVLHYLDSCKYEDNQTLFFKLEKLKPLQLFTLKKYFKKKYPNLIFIEVRNRYNICDNYEPEFINIQYRVQTKNLQRLMEYYLSKIFHKLEDTRKQHRYTNIFFSFACFSLTSYILCYIIKYNYFLLVIPVLILFAIFICMFFDSLIN